MDLQRQLKNLAIEELKQIRNNENAVACNCSIVLFLINKKQWTYLTHCNLKFPKT